MVVLNILIGIIILSIIVIIHELGHFFACKMMGVKVEEFGLGFPPRALKLFKKNGTLYSLNWIPFGGFNKILGESESSSDKRAYCNQGVWKRIFIASGGIILNLLLAWILLTVWFGILPSVKLPNYVAIVSVEKNSLAEQSGLRANDFILKINDQNIAKTEEVSDFIKNNHGKELSITIKHRGKDETKIIFLPPDANSKLGIAMSETGGEIISYKWYQAPLLAIEEMWAITVATFKYLGAAIASVFGGAKVAFELTGPVGIVTFISQTAAIGWIFVLRLCAIISLGFALCNILPIPAVDGGRLLFLWLEAIFGKKIINDNVENIVHGVGLILLIILSLFIVYMDIVRFM
ncbi:MAG: M50 family metallopeptidase [Patescibacteria group bacterium]|nr:M50 family metallopeptidase [Patescibacteria group bacterium]